MHGSHRYSLKRVQFNHEYRMSIYEHLFLQYSQNRFWQSFLGWVFTSFLEKFLCFPSLLLLNLDLQISPITQQQSVTAKSFMYYCNDYQLYISQQVTVLLLVKLRYKCGIILLQQDCFQCVLFLRLFCFSSNGLLSSGFSPYFLRLCMHFASRWAITLQTQGHLMSQKSRFNLFVTRIYVALELLTLCWNLIGVFIISSINCLTAIDM